MASADSSNFSLHDPPIPSNVRQRSASQLSVDGLGPRGLSRELSAPDRFERQSSDSLARPISRSGSRTGPTSLNIPLSTQQPSIILSAAGERVRAFSDSLNAKERADADSYGDAHQLNNKPLSPQREVEEITPVSHSQQRPKQSTSPLPMPSSEEVTLIAFVNFNSGGKTVTTPHTHYRLPHQFSPIFLCLHLLLIACCRLSLVLTWVMPGYANR